MNMFKVQLRITNNLKVSFVSVMKNWLFSSGSSSVMILRLLSHFLENVVSFLHRPTGYPCLELPWCFWHCSSIGIVLIKPHENSMGMGLVDLWDHFIEPPCSVLWLGISLSRNDFSLLVLYCVIGPHLECLPALVGHVKIIVCYWWR